MVLRAQLLPLVQARLPAGTPKVDHKTMDATFTAMEAQNLLRIWSVDLPGKTNGGRVVQHVFLLRPLGEGEGADAGKDVAQAARLVEEHLARTSKEARRHRP